MIPKVKESFLSEGYTMGKPRVKVRE